MHLPHHPHRIHMRAPSPSPPSLRASLAHRMLACRELKVEETPKEVVNDDFGQAKKSDSKVERRDGGNSKRKGWSWWRKGGSESLGCRGANGRREKIEKEYVCVYIYQCRGCKVRGRDEGMEWREKEGRGGSSSGSR
jgi:hypothetical protein